MSMRAIDARIGPTVWDDEGPMPMLNRSTTLTKFADMPGMIPDCGLRRARRKVQAHIACVRAGMSVAPSTEMGFCVDLPCSVMIARRGTAPDGSGVLSASTAAAAVTVRGRKIG